MTRRLDEALRPGGLYYLLDGTAVDAEGRPLEGAPKRPDDTKPEDQPYARMVAASSVGATGAPMTPGGAATMDYEAIGRGIAAGLQQAAGRAAANVEATKTSDAAHAELLDGARSAKVDPKAAPSIPTSATADLGVGLPPAGDAEQRRAAINAATEAANRTVREADAARVATTAAFVTGDTAARVAGASALATPPAPPAPAEPPPPPAGTSGT